jgi:hypothetical protein
MSENEALAVAEEVSPSDPPALSEDGGTGLPDTPPKARSGFQRQKLKVAALQRRIQELEDDYDRACSDFEQLERDYAALEAGFNELSALNEALASELRQLKQRRPEPVRYGTTNLMGM